MKTMELLLILNSQLCEEGMMLMYQLSQKGIKTFGNYIYGNEKLKDKSRIFSIS